MLTSLRTDKPVAPGFEHVHRYWDKKTGQYGAKIKPGEYFVSEEGEPITTVLGSCVSVCARDTVFRIGGMNHFLLPEGSNHSSWSDASRYGAFAIEALLNEVYKRGGRKKAMEIKVFGGSNILGSNDVGQSNVDFVIDYMRTEGFLIASKDLGGNQPRKIIYYPDTGKVMLKKVAAIEITEVAAIEKRHLNKIGSQPVTGEVDLF